MLATVNIWSGKKTPGLRCRFLLTMIVVIAKHGYIEKQYCYFVIVSLELYRQKCHQFLGSLCLKVGINWRSQQARLAVRYSFALATSMQSTKRVRSSNTHCHNCVRVTHLQVHFIFCWTRKGYNNEAFLTGSQDIPGTLVSHGGEDKGLLSFIRLIGAVYLKKTPG